MFEDHSCHLRLSSTPHSRTDRMRANRVRIDAEERYRDERAVPTQPQDSVSQLQSSLVLVRITLVKVDV